VITAETEGSTGTTRGRGPLRLSLRAGPRHTGTITGTALTKVRL
jgi:hypothetical protein